LAPAVLGIGLLAARRPAHGLLDVVRTFYPCMGWRYLRPMGLALTPLAAGVVVATVYLGYHHGLDSLAGVAWGALCVWLGLRLLRQRNAPQAPQAV
jgi:membrane-associated phospholipid phosphatase